MKQTGGRIKKILPDSLAKKAGLKINDIILTVKDKPLYDILDYLYFTYYKNIILNIKRKNKSLKFKVKKSYSQPLGIKFEKPIFDKIHLCQNKCIFCFVDQLPKKLRPSLYIKDDDFRLSLLDGNFITLTNLTPEMWRKIKKLHLSPLYISVHATDPELRSFLFGTRRASLVLNQLKRLAKINTTMHTQIVVIPNINDKKNLDKTIIDLSKLYPKVASIGIVPVGITKYYKGNILKPVSKKLAHEICQKIRRYQNKFLKRYNNPLVYAADEFYLKAGLKIPSKKYYDTFCQIENGIGLVRNFLDDFQCFMKKLPEKIKSSKKFSLICGELFYPFLCRIVKSLNKIKGLKIKVFKIKNNFFGSSVNVTGLLTGQDIYFTLKNKNLLDYLIIPDVCLKDNHLFLDDLSVKDLSKKLKIKIMILKAEAEALVNHIISRLQTPDFRRQIKESEV